MTENKVISENLVAVRELWEIRLYKRHVTPLSALQSVRLWLVARNVYRGEFLKVNP